MPSDRGLGKEDVVHNIPSGTLLSHRKDEMPPPFATTRMDLAKVMPGEVGQTDKAKNYMISCPCGI